MEEEPVMLGKLAMDSTKRKCLNDVKKIMEIAKWMD